MPTTADRPYRPTRGDSIAIWIFIVAGVLIATFTAVQVVRRAIELLSPGPVQVLAAFVGTPAQAPIGQGGADVAVGLDRAVLTVDSLPIASVAAGVIGQALLLVTVLTVVLCLILLSRNILRGRVFSRANTALVTTAGMVGLLGSAGAAFFENMVANGAIARLGEFPNHAALSVEPLPFILAAFVIAIISTAFTVGDRLQKDTEGLV